MQVRFSQMPASATALDQKHARTTDDPITMWITSDTCHGPVSIPDTQRGRIVYAAALAQGLGQPVGCISPRYTDAPSALPPLDHEPALVITSDDAVAAKAFLIARFGGQTFLPLTWIGSFDDQDGVFFAYVRRAYSISQKIMHAIELNGGSPEALQAKWMEVRDDMRSAPPLIRRYRILFQLRNELAVFEGALGRTILPLAPKTELLLLEDREKSIFLDGENLLPDLSRRQISNILHTARLTAKSGLECIV